MKHHRSAYTGVLVLALCLLCSILPAQVSIGGNVFDGGGGGPLLAGTVYHVNSSLTVPPGQTLTVQPGAIVKFGAALLMNVQGTLLVPASAGNPAIFTEIRDDSAGGDTNGDGPTVGVPGFWRGIVMLGGTLDLTGLEIRFCGQSGYAGIRLDATPGSTVTDCVFRDYSSEGIDYVGVGSVTVTGCSFLNGNTPVAACPLSSLATFTGNTASGNSNYDVVRVVGGTVNGSFTIPASSVMGGAHVLTGSLTIASAAAVTVEAGVVFKVGNGALAINIDGTLVCNGSAGNPVVFTEIRDDLRGGDTNQDGAATLPLKSFWRGLTFTANSDASSLAHTVVSYTGQSNFAAIDLVDADITLDNCLFDHGGSSGVDLNGNASLPVITDCHFEDVREPINSAHFKALENFSGNTSANCFGRSVITVTESNFGGIVSFGGDNLIDGVLALSGTVTFAAGSNVTIDQAAIIKMAAAATRIVVDGTLICDGSTGEIVFTDFRDDSHGGDSNADGAATSGVPGYWRGLGFGGTADASVLDNVRVRYTGQSGFAGITLTDADITLTNSVIEDGTSDGLSLANSSAVPTVTGCAFDRCNIAVDDLKLDQLVGFSGNSATGNTSRDLIQVGSSILFSNLSLTTDNLINDVVEMQGSPTVASGVSLTLGPGIIMKFTLLGTQFVIDGTLTCNGTAANPVVFTEIDDDDHGGDSANDGPTVGTPGQWRGLSFRTGSDASLLDHVIVRFSGQSSFAGIEILGSNFTMVNSRIADCSQAALDFNGTAATPTIRDCVFENNLYAMRGMRWDNFANLRENQASGNTIYDASFVEFPAVAADTEVQAAAVTGGAVVFSSSPNIATGVRLTFGRGLILKCAALALRIDDGAGTIDVEGSGLEPVVFTTVEDDEWGGDTNKDGPSVGTPNRWRGLLIDSAAGCVVKHAVIRFCGQSGFPSLECNSSTATIRSVRVEHSNQEGFQISAVNGPMDNLVAYSCGGPGIDLTGLAGSQPLRFATVHACGTGIDAGATWTGAIQSSISWGNVTNYAGATAVNLFDSNGSAALAGTNGNIDVDPLFVDAANGDLNLQVSSPCIDAGNFNLGKIVAGDHFESSRVNDHDLNGSVGADMGAYEFCNWDMSFAGEPRLGQTLTFTMNGNPALVVISIALLDFQYYYPPYGMVLCGSPFTLLHQDIWFVNYGYPVLIPNDPFAVGYEIGVQMGCAVYGNTMVGNIANLYRGVIRD